MKAIIELKENELNSISGNKIGNKIVQVSNKKIPIRDKNATAVMLVNPIKTRIILYNDPKTSAVVIHKNNGINRANAAIDASNDII